MNKVVKKAYPRTHQFPEAIIYRVKSFPFQILELNGRGQQKPRMDGVNMKEKDFLSDQVDRVYRHQSLLSKRRDILEMRKNIFYAVLNHPHTT